jgi:hypothetical protein
MARPRRSAQAALLTDGRVLVTGGLGPEITSVPEAEIYTPATNVWAAAGTVSGGGPGATLTALRNGKALLAGGQIDPDEQSGRRDALLYDPAANAWTTLPSMAYARTSHTATLMPDGRVVVAGGIDRGRGVPSIEIYSPTCTSAASCGTGFCVDGFCCNEACTSPCFACSSAKKSLGTDGVCGPVAQGTDPDSECPLEPEASCGGTGFCNGAGACTLHPQGTVCTPPACSGSVRNRGSTCTGSGQCVARGVEDCTPYECAAGACRSTCTTDDQCGPAGYCAGSVCTGKKPVGVSCRTDAECFTGACADGVCCEQACVTGPCQACSLARGASAEGTCTVLTGRCDDGDRCTIGERCEQGACGGGTALDCGPEDACHERACDPSTGCIAKPLPDGERCDDHSECTREDACVAGNCKGEPLNLCPAPGPCEELALCDTADGACVTVKRPDGAACDDVDPCTVSDACTGGVCAGVPRECLGDECHDAGSCGADGRCSRPPLPDGTRCSAGACMGGICTAAALPADAGVPPLAPDAGAPAAPRGSDDGCGCRTVASGVGSRSAWLAVAIAAQALARRRDRRKRGLP